MASLIFRSNAANARPLEHASLHVVLQKEHARHLLRDRAGAEPLAVDDVVDRRDDDARHAEAEVLLEIGVLARHDRLTENRG